MIVAIIIGTLIAIGFIVWLDRKERRNHERNQSP